MAEVRRPVTRGSAELASEAFRREREAGWRELEALLTRAEKKGMRALGPEEVVRLPALYRAALSSLSVARAISLDRNLRDHLESLAVRAWLRVYGPQRSALGVLAEYFAARFPDAVRRNALAVAASASCLAAGMVTGLAMVSADPDLYHSLMPESVAQGRNPASSTAELRAVLHGGREHAPDDLAFFTSHLFTHNSQVGILCFALGFLGGLPVILLLYFQGLILGAMTALYQSRGLGVEWWGWVLPHGITELGAIVLCGAGGLLTGRALLFPGRWRRIENLRRHGREAATLVMGAVLMLFAAGLIEGVFRQRVHDVGARYTMALLTAAAWGAYFLLSGRRASR